MLLISLIKIDFIIVIHKIKMFGTNSGDWKCVCGEKNFSKRDNCRKCKKSKLNNKNTSEGVWGTNKDDWSCGCGEMNFAKRIKCRKCNKDRNEGSSSVQIENNDCVVCLDRKKTYIITKCGHLCLCEVCCLAITSCPICRMDYNVNTDLLKVYNS